MNDRFENSIDRPNRWRVAAAERGASRNNAEDLIESLLNEIDVTEDGPNPEPETESPPPITPIPDDDPQLTAAVHEAHCRFDEFLHAFAHRSAADRFAVKARFMDDYGREDMWLTVTAVDGSHIYGELDNDPGTIRAIRRGQPVRVPRAGLNDWLYTKGAERIGGFTAKVIERRQNGEAA